MKIALNFVDVSQPPEDYGRYPVLVKVGGKKEIVTANYYHPPGAACEGWFDSTDKFDANPIQVVAWAKPPKALKG